MTSQRALLHLGAAVLTGCNSFGSISPLLKHDAAQYDPQLLGTWLDSARTMSIFVTEVDSAYEVAITTSNRGERRSYSAELGQLDGLRVLELLPQDPELRYGDAFSDLNLSLYYPVVVESLGAADASIRILDLDALRDYLRQKKGAIAHEIRKYDAHSQMIVTAPTEKWRQFFRSYVRRADATTSMRFERLPTPVLNAAADIRGQQYRLGAPGQCLHVRVRSSRFALVPGQVWRASAAAETASGHDLSWLELQIFEPDSGNAASFILQLGGPELAAIDVSARQSLPVQRHDSVTVLTVEGPDAGGDNVRVRIECSTVTELTSM